MLVYKAKLRGTQTQYRIIDEILRTSLFVRNKVGAGLAVNLVFKQTNPSTKPAPTALLDGQSRRKRRCSP